MYVHCLLKNWSRYLGHFHYLVVHDCSWIWLKLTRLFAEMSEIGRGRKHSKSSDLSMTTNFGEISVKWKTDAFCPFGIVSTSFYVRMSRFDHGNFLIRMIENGGSTNKHQRRMRQKLKVVNVRFYDWCRYEELITNKHGVKCFDYHIK